MILISACLAGYPCRWDGQAKENARIVELVRQGRAIPVCPEQLGGLGTPRKPSEIREGRVFSSDGQDVTAQFEGGARAVLAIARKYGCAEAILKANSPSCGCGRVYDGSFSGALVDGDGIAARLLKEAGIKVSTEDDI
jgi:uncharacterized protein YbbK (DUF523 family)